MRTILVTLSMAAALLVVGCTRPRTIDLDTGLRGTQRGEYTLVAISDQFVSFQNSSHKDQYYFTTPLPPEVLARIQAAVAAGSTSLQPIHFMDARATPPPVPNHALQRTEAGGRLFSDLHA